MESYSSFCTSSCIFVYAFIICINHASSIFQSEDSYTKHCSSIIPPSSITARSDGGSLPSLSTSYFTGGDRFQNTDPRRTYSYVQKNLKLRLRSDHYTTTAAGVYKVGGFLNINFPFGLENAPLGLPVDGFWSASSRKLCMVGSALWKGIDFDAVLKLKFDGANPTIHTGVVSGSLESAASANDGAYFDPILIFDFPASVSDYSYSLLSEEIGAVFPTRRDESLSLDSTESCSVMERGPLMSLELQYAAACAELPRPRGCTPIGLGDEFLPNYLALESVQCVKGEKRARFLAKFLNFSRQDYDNFAVGSTLTGEAWWDGRNNRIVGVACEILNPSLNLEKSVGDCSMILSLRRPSSLTMRNDGVIVGEIWSSKAVEDSGYFRQINLTIVDEIRSVDLPKQRYEYREMDRARKWCTNTKKKKKKRGSVYPDGQSFDMSFNVRIKNVKGEEVGSADVDPVRVENNAVRSRNDMLFSSDAEPPIPRLPKSGGALPTKMSYKISIQPSYSLANSSNQILTSSIDWPVMYPRGRILITAEGEYDAESGQLCMVGCRKLARNSIATSKDCEIVVEFDLPMLSGERGRRVKGIIRSTRPQSDPLHFDDLRMDSAAYNLVEAERSIWRMGFEIAMVLISSTLVCTFVALQIFHLKRNPEVVSSVSLFMLVVLCAGNVIPLVLNFEEAEKASGRLEANEVAVRVMALVALVLQLRLIQLVSTSKNSWGGERRAGFVSASFYILGCLLASLLMKTYTDWRDSIWRDLRCYGGVILDGFLLPQILLNIVKGSSSSKALRRSFYFGTSAVRLAPHVYNQYRAHNYPKNDLSSTYYYGNPAANLYSAAWDSVASCGIIALAVIVFLQQRHGGLCILPQRFRFVLKF